MLWSCSLEQPSACKGNTEGLTEYHKPCDLQNYMVFHPQLSELEWSELVSILDRQHEFNLWDFDLDWGFPAMDTNHLPAKTLAPTQ